VGGSIVNETAQSETGTLSRVLVKHARDAFRDGETAAEQWRALNFTGAPDFDNAVREYDRFIEILGNSGASLEYLPFSEAVGLDSIYVRDASVVCDRGVILCRMGKPLRAQEPGAQEATLRALGCPVVGAIAAPGILEGGDVVWLGQRTIAVGQGYRTNAEGIAQLRSLLGGAIDDFIVVPLPHWRGPGDVFHLMSIISPVDRDLAVVYSRLLPVPFRDALLDRGIVLVEVPDDEFESLGGNVLTLSPRQCVVVAGNPITRSRLERAGAEVREYEGTDISLKGGGGPTCLTRPLSRLDPEAEL
jgi:N-dimethylarginine dimethylaminohydrolase